MRQSGRAVIVATLGRKNIQIGTSLPFVTHWKVAEDAVAGLFDVAAHQRQLYRKPPGFTGGRVADMIDDDNVMHEVKSGFVTFRSKILEQIEKDAALPADMEGQNAGIRGVVWHFVGGRTGSLGAGSRVLNLLDDKLIPYVIHLP